MRIVIVGSTSQRKELRRKLAGAAIEIVDEAETLEAARTTIAADAFLVARGQPESDDLGDPLVEPLTGRELEVLQLLAEGLPNKAIAVRLGISDQTVKFHVAAIGGKLGAMNRTDAVRLAIRRGLVHI